MRRGKRALALLLALLTITTSISFPSATVRAEEGDDPSDVSSGAVQTVAETEDGSLFLSGTMTLKGVLQFGDFSMPEKIEAPHCDTAVGQVSGDDTAAAQDEALEPVGEYLYRELRARNPEIDLSAYRLSAQSASGILTEVINDHPDLYYVENNVSYTCDKSTDVVATISTLYADGSDDAAFNAAVKDALSWVKSGMTDVQKALVLHDYLVLNCEYDYENYLNHTIPWESYQAYGALVNHKAVCNGYTLAYQYLLAQLGIDSGYVISGPMNHAWNVVKLNGKYYHVDVTWDDPVADRFAITRYHHFLCTDQEMTENLGHYDWDAGGLKCTDKTYETAFWKALGNNSAPVIMTGNSGYYIHNRTFYKKNFRENLTSHGDEIFQCELYLYMTGMFQANGRLYFNDDHAIHSIDPESSAANKDLREEFRPDDGSRIYGVMLRDGKVYYLSSSNGSSAIKTAPWYVLGKLSAKDTLASGEIKESYGNILWAIDKEKNLFVKGTGDFAPSSDSETRAPWHSYADQIATAEIRVTGMKNASCMLAGCKNLETLRLAGFNAEQLTSANKMLSGCDSLTRIETPISLKNTRIELPAGPHDTWYLSKRDLYDNWVPEYVDPDTGKAEDGIMAVTEIPQNLDKSISLKKETARISATKTKTLYTSGDVLNVDDIAVEYTLREGVTSKVTDFTTNADKIDMQTPGAKQLVVTYRDMECAIELTVLVKGLFGEDQAYLRLSKRKTNYMADERLGLDDLSVFYCDEHGNTEIITDYETNAKAIDMHQAGPKALIVTGRGITASIELMVFPNESHYMIRFDGNGADWGDMESLLVQRGKAQELSANVYGKTGYHFAGWNTVADGSGTRYEDKASVTDLTADAVVALYAIWEANTYTVKYQKGVSDAKGSMEDQSLSYDSVAELSPNKFTYANHAFAGWKDAKGNVYRNKQAVANLTIADSGEIVLTALWESGFTISYVLAEGAVNSPANPNTFLCSAVEPALYEPVRPGYDFVGWYTEKALKNKIDKIPEYTSRNLTLYARWSAKKVTIEFDANRPTAAPAAITVRGTMPTQTVKYGSNTKLKKSAYKITGYTFQGWNTRADGSGRTYDDNAVADLALIEAASPVKLYACWKPVQYKISYSGSADGKSDVTNELPVTYTVESGNISLNTLNGRAYKPVRPGYTFDGWYKNSKLTKSAGEAIDVSTAKNITLYAKWIPRKTNVVFDPNWPAGSDGKTKGSMADQTLTYAYGKTKKLSAVKYTVGGYLFAGWDTDPKGRGTRYANSAEAGKDFFLAHGDLVTLYAQWEEYAYKITYAGAVVGKGGVSANDNPQGHNGEERIVLRAPERKGYRFAGWYQGRDLLENNILSNPGAKNVTVTAKWTGISSVITFDPNKPEDAPALPEVTGAMAARTITYGTTRKLPAANYRLAGYTFRGWSKVKNPGEGDTIYSNKAAVTPEMVGENGGQTLYAQWKPVEYKISYVDATAGKNGVVRNDNPAVYTVENTAVLGANSMRAGALVLAAPTRTGYVFAGWYTDKKLKKPLTAYDTSAKKKVTFYAKWVPVTYHIVYDANGGDGDPVVQTAVYDKSGKLLPNRFTRQGRTFYGWSTVREPKTGDPIFADRASVKGLTTNAKITLYAQWR